MTTDGPSLPQRDPDGDLFAQIDAVLGSGEYGNVTDRLVEFVEAREAGLRGKVEEAEREVGRWQQKWKRRGVVIEDLKRQRDQFRRESAEHLALMSGADALALLASSPTTHESEA